MADRYHATISGLGPVCVRYTELVLVLGRALGLGASLVLAVAEIRERWVDGGIIVRDVVEGDVNMLQHDGQLLRAKDAARECGHDARDQVVHGEHREVDELPLDERKDSVDVLVRVAHRVATYRGSITQPAPVRGARWQMEKVEGKCDFSGGVGFGCKIKGPTCVGSRA